MRWLQGLNAIVIDPVKCPCVLQEFLEWEYEVAPDGTVLGTLMDANATVSTRRGMPAAASGSAKERDK